MIPEIANQMVKISSTLNTCDMSDQSDFEFLIFWGGFNLFRPLYLKVSG